MTVSPLAGPPRVAIGPLEVDRLSFDDAVDRIVDLAASKKGGYIVTPNIDHVVIADQDPRFRAAYEDAALSVCDGFPLLVTSRLLGARLPEKISGSDLAMPVLRRAAEQKLTVFFLGAGPGVAEKAKAKVCELLPGIRIVGTSAPMVNMDDPPSARDAIVAELKAASPHLVFVAFGAPKQELLCHEIAPRVSPSVLLGVGATLDFLAGTVKRAPSWMSRVGLEWAFRLAQEPKRLAHRYLVRDTQYPFIVAKHALKRRISKT